MVSRARFVLFLLLFSSVVVLFTSCGGGSSSSPKPVTPTLPTVSLVSVTAITQTTATSGGTITSDGGATITARGVVWAASANPTTANSSTSDGTGSGAFSSNLTGLTRATTYHIRAYATNSVGTAYSADATFTTSAALPTVTTTEAGNVTSTTASSGGNVTDDGGASITARGVAWSTSANPTVSGSHTSDGTGTGNFSSSLTGLTGSTTYHLRAYASNVAGTAYGSDTTFTTLAPVYPPTVTTAVLTNVTNNSADGGGSVTSDGGATIVERGLVWGTTNPPAVSGNKSITAGTTGDFSASLTGLAMKTTYYVRAYATNAAGTGYGSVQTIATLNQYNLPAAVSPMVTNQWMTFAWPDNAYYPLVSDTSAGDLVNGRIGNACGPTSLAKTLGFWKVATGSGVIDADDDTHAGAHWYLDLSAMHLDYTKISDAQLSSTATEDQYRDVATLFEAAGAVGFTHGIGGGVIADDLYPNMAPYFNMSPAVHVLHDWEYTADDWSHLVEFELAKGRPLIVAGRTAASVDPWVGGGEGHWWNVDGYNGQDQVHMAYNFWDHSGTPIAGYYSIADMGPATFNSGQSQGYTKGHFVIFDFLPQIASTSDPVVETHPANNPTSVTARVSGAVLGEGNATVMERGFHVEAPGINAYDVPVGFGPGHFYATLNGLQPSTGYTVKAYAQTAAQRVYGETQSFTTLSSGAVPDAVMPLLDDFWTVNQAPYNSALPVYAGGPGGHWYNEQGTMALARMLHFWRAPSNGSGTFTHTINSGGTQVQLSADMSSLNLDYGKMFNKLTVASTSNQISETARFIAALEAYDWGATDTGAGNLNGTDPDAGTVSLLVNTFGLDDGLHIVRQEDVTADAWAVLLKSEIAAGRPVMVIGRNSQSVAPGASGYVGAAWFVVDGYRADGTFHSDFSMGMTVMAGWFTPDKLAGDDIWYGYNAYHRALIGFKPAAK